MLFQIIRTTSSCPDFIDLVQRLDNYLSILDGNEHEFYHQFNKIDNLYFVALLYINDKAIACGAIKEFESGKMEVKRMYTDIAYRGKGYASLIINDLEKWAKELGATSCILETGKKMHDAVALYKNRGYHVIPNYGQYVGIENSICFEKIL